MSRVLLRVEGDVRVYRSGNKILRIAGPSRPAGFYALFGGSRQAMYKGAKDPRKDPARDEIIRSLRAAGKLGRSVSPGKQSL